MGLESVNDSLLALTNITVLSLAKIDSKNEDIKYLLSTCSRLNVLWLYEMDALTSISGWESHSLRSLDIDECALSSINLLGLWGLEEVSSSCMLSFHYCAP